jgi:prepilin-type N-terminal cleavage/methylation domain-containing protein
MGRIPAGIYPPGPGSAVKRCAADQKGVTLAELLVSLALGLIVMTLVVNLLVVMHTSNRQQADHAELLYAGQVVQQVLQNEVRNALKVKVINGGKKLLVTNAQGGVTGFYSSGGNFYREYITANPVAENVQAVYFTESEGCLLVDLALQRDQEYMEINFACAIRCE